MKAKLFTFFICLLILLIIMTIIAVGRENYNLLVVGSVAIWVGLFLGIIWDWIETRF